MADLIAITYPGIDQARTVLDTAKRLMREHVLDLQDAVYVTKDARGEVDLHQMVNLPGVGAVTGGSRGALWGGLVGLLFLQPLTGAVIGGAIGAASGAIAGKLTDYGIDDGFIKELSTRMTPNTSAIFLLVQSATVDKVLPEIAKHGGTVLRTSLSDEAEERLQMALTQMVPIPDAHTTDAAPPSA